MTFREWSERGAGMAQKDEKPGAVEVFECYVHGKRWQE